MRDLLEPALRDTLEKRAAQLDPAVRRRLMAIDYQPRRQRLPVLPALGVVGLAGAAVTLALIFTLGSSPAPAFAGWSPTPTSAKPGQAEAALARCRRGRSVLTDTRGPFTAQGYARPHGVGTCLQGPGVSLNSTTSMQPAIHGGAIEVFEQTTFSRGVAATLLDGRVAAGVRGVHINLSNGRRITATVAHGWYLAWWPGKPHATTAVITRAHRTQTVALPASATVGAGSCGGAPGTACASVGPGASVGG